MLVVYTSSGYISSDINHAVISFVYTAIGCACGDFIPVYAAVGYTKNDINLGCTTIEKIKLCALLGYRITVHASYVHHCSVCY